ncbi:hypothetical protein [Jiangella rhizosphaerae]|uniref:Uncharacterized protein n=1 Tax=Jiangella rhizosphaerae TaxID=2293569 RepID=A0A418KLC3_9ACTN|nr:hypothetical protein [Jiangella rhizosphaerae]RIQ18331.1 hypothetical protein DY240_21455 [Jiangella rhizosphaerae]
MSHTAGRDDELPPGQRADILKERIYITFTALAVVLALRAHAVSAAEAALSLAVVVLGTVLAVFVADVVSHIAVHEVLPVREELRHMARVSLGALGALVLPGVFIGLAVADVWEIEPALRASSIALVAALAAIGYLAVRRARLPTWQRVVVLFAEVVLGLVVIGLELLAHNL